MCSFEQLIFNFALNRSAGLRQLFNYPSVFDITEFDKASTKGGQSRSVSADATRASNNFGDLASDADEPVRPKVTFASIAAGVASQSVRAIATNDKEVGADLSKLNLSALERIPSPVKCPAMDEAYLD